MHKSNSITGTRKRLLIILFSITFLFFCLIIRLACLQLIDGRSLKEKAEGQWYRDLPLNAPRGKILDAEGRVLADSEDSWTIYVRPAAAKANAKIAAQVLSRELKLNESELLEKIEKSKVGEITIKRNVNTETAEKIRAENLTGVYAALSSKRTYPYDSFLTQVMGFTNIDGVGQNGIEGYYDKYLKGTDGKLLTGSDIKGKETNEGATYLKAIPGCDVSLSIDLFIQGFCETAAVAALEEWKAKSTSIMVMDCETGGVLASVNYPSFDLNNPPRDNIEMLNALSKNKMITDVYEPGSTFKIFTTAAALSEGVVSDANRFYCNGKRLVDSKSIKCWRSIGHGSQTLSEGVKNSCNCVFMDLALKMGTKTLYKNLKNFGFNSKTNIDFYGESRGILMNESSVKNVDLARIGFGQAVAVTPLQLLSGVVSVVNGGNYLTPYFADKVTAPDGKIVYERKAESKRVISKEVSKKMSELLEGVVSSGSGKKAAVPGFRVGGKTGTAQKYENGHIAEGKYISSFVGFAPVEKPKYAILVIIDEPSYGAYYGSIVAAPYAGKILGQIFDYKGIKGEVVDKEKVFSMPDVIGKSVTEAAEILKQYGLNFEMTDEGTSVTATLPMPGAAVVKNDVVLLRT